MSGCDLLHWLVKEENDISCLTEFAMTDGSSN